jgi:DNA mismatch repair protein MutS2
MGELSYIRRLKEVKGLGPSRIEMITRRVGGEEELKKLLERGDVSALSSLEGISSRMAVQIILAGRGSAYKPLDMNETARNIHSSIIDSLRSRMHTDAARNKVLLLNPGGDLRKRSGEAVINHDLRDLLKGRDRSRIRELLKALGSSATRKTPRAAFPYVILAEDDEVCSSLKDKGIDRHCLVATPDEMVVDDRDIIYVYNRRIMDEEGIPYVHSASMFSEPEEIIPDIAASRWIRRVEELGKLSELRRIFGIEDGISRAVEILEIFDSIDRDVMDADAINENIERIREEVEHSIGERISELTITGDDAISILKHDDPDVLKEIYREHGEIVKKLMKERLGLTRDVFIMKYPMEVDQEALTRLIDDLRGENASSRFARKVNLAVELKTIEPEITDGLKWIEDIDFRFGIGCMVEDFDLRPFDRSEGWFGISGAGHLDLREGGGYQKITYHLGDVPEGVGDLFPGSDVSKSRISLLTGANSGGKTTLLETIVQVLLMAYMGLPVPADKAFLPDIERLFLYRPKRGMDAGGLESFLREILPMSLGANSRTMIMADELEAMTELEAASRIIGGFLGEVGKRSAYSVVITHMAQNILEYVNIRVDGIEAKGLDREHRLIVDRTPRIGYHARSTPELILRSMAARSSGEEGKLYSSILESFPGE